MATEKTVHRIVSEYVRRLNGQIRVKKAILTGSWANGSYLEDSDVDLVVVSDDFADMPLPRRLVLLQKLWKSWLPLEAFGYTTTESRTWPRRVPTSRMPSDKESYCSTQTKATPDKVLKAAGQVPTGRPLEHARPVLRGSRKRSVEGLGIGRRRSIEPTRHSPSWLPSDALPPRDKL